MNTNTKRRSAFYRFAMSLACTLFIATGFLLATDTHALSGSYTIKLCERAFIGTEYKPYLESRCSLIWEHLTYQIWKQ